eukprot:TRINITY_DN5082_c0_g2_i1.p1 TRINITY_DN5082_c0_g2~~TRINITY_DN5082_c0_g2_i1.p1  ORF type:complete len:225 (+),score=35.83 TRINITY_DN5082_c0_g2_i1:532-1206(+)
MAIGNDVLGDEFVKCPHLTALVESGLQRHKEAQLKGAYRDQDASAEALRDILAEALTDRSVPSGSLLLMLKKFFTVTSKRPAQPGLCTALTLFPVLLLATLSLGLLCAPSLLAGSVFGVLSAVLVSIACGLLHHVELQRLFVNVQVPLLSKCGLCSSFHFATSQQSIVLVSEDGEVFYFYRDTFNPAVPNQGTLGLATAAPHKPSSSLPWKLMRARVPPIRPVC